MKIFIVGAKHINKLDIAKEIVSLNDDLNICKTFTSNTIITNDNYEFYLDIDDIILSFKNNALLFLYYSEKQILGITLDDFYNSDIIPIRIDHFNMIIDDYINNKEDSLFVWLDSKEKTENHKMDLIEAKYFQERVDTFSLPVLYFCNEDKTDIAKIILDYILADENTREEILEENS